jgi:hypothetical protein
MSYGGANLERGSVVVIGPEHAHLLASHGWTRKAVKEFLWQNWGRRRGDLKRFGLTYRVGDGPDDEFIRFGESPDSLLLIVAGARNAGVSTVIAATSGTARVVSRPIADPIH